ncbi:hypothetical protein COO60DRAFT_1548183 [Scenedesmus sp. NREL 46B-D3]|nr:hypothetical protein COO60DRAFT_1548183 [Scenedesmus sp. NREL 46B-D3]
MAGPVCTPFANHDNHFGLRPGHPTVVGFQQAQQRRDSHGKEQPSSAVARGRSLLSELLLKEEGSGHYEVASCCSMDPCSSDTEEDDASLGWGSFCRDMELDRLERLADSTLGSGESDTCSAKSQPVPIPSITHSYFKDEMQRAALEKLNQKRKWYQQQLEAERMMSRSIAKSKQVGRNGAGWLPMANDVLRGFQHPVRFAPVLKPVCVPAAVGIKNGRMWHGAPASWHKRRTAQPLLLLLRLLLLR